MTNETITELLLACVDSVRVTRSRLVSDPLTDTVTTAERPLVTVCLRGGLLTRPVDNGPASSPDFTAPTEGEALRQAAAWLVGTLDKRCTALHQHADETLKESARIAALGAPLLAVVR